MQKSESSREADLAIDVFGFAGVVMSPRNSSFWGIASLADANGTNEFRSTLKLVVKRLMPFLNT
jgi:hypothetical protein